MYCAGLGLRVLGSFEDHEGFDGIMLGRAGMPYHLEFTTCRTHPMTPRRTEEDLFVCYVPDADARSKIPTVIASFCSKRTGRLAKHRHGPDRPRHKWKGSFASRRRGPSRRFRSSAAMEATATTGPVDVGCDEVAPDRERLRRRSSGQRGQGEGGEWSIGWGRAAESQSELMMGQFTMNPLAAKVPPSGAVTRPWSASPMTSP
jgi:hypothetical protein